MKIEVKSLTLSAIMLCATAAFAVDKAQVDVPFPFTAVGQSFPAGHYTIAMGLHNSVVTMSSSQNSAKQITWLTVPADAASSVGKVTFSVSGTNRSLESIQLGSRSTPNLDHEKGRSRQTVSVSTSVSGQ